MHGVSPGECAVRLVKAGTQIYSHMFSFSSFYLKAKIIKSPLVLQVPRLWESTATLTP